MKLRILAMVLPVMCLAGCGTSELDARSTNGPVVTEDAFAGKWVEYWPKISQHAIHVITKHGNQYAIEGSSPRTTKYVISNVRLEGDCLKFAEGTAIFTVEYELRAKNQRTLSVRAKGRSGWRTDIVWRRDQ